MSSPGVHFIISTHTPRHLRRVLLGVAAQTPPAASVTVTCDVRDAAIAEVVRDVALGCGRPAVLVQREHTGKSRSSQVRNNGVRALLARGVREGLLVFLDGDCGPTRDLGATYQAICPPKHVAIGFRHDLSPQQTEAFNASLPGEERTGINLGAEQVRALNARAGRYRRQALLRRLGLGKGHKPKILSANFAVWLSDYAAVNGFDEAYEGYGQEDDDLTRRLYRHGCRPVIAVDRAIVYHQYHPTRAPVGWHESPNASRFAAGASGPARCERGLENPLPQPPVEVSEVGASMAASHAS